MTTYSPSIYPTTYPTTHPTVRPTIPPTIPPTKFNAGKQLDSVGSIVITIVYVTVTLILICAIFSITLYYIRYRKRRKRFHARQRALNQQQMVIQQQISSNTVNTVLSTGLGSQYNPYLMQMTNSSSPDATHMPPIYQMQMQIAQQRQQQQQQQLQIQQRNYQQNINVGKMNNHLINMQIPKVPGLPRVISNTGEIEESESSSEEEQTFGQAITVG